MKQYRLMTKREILREISRLENEIVEDWSRKDLLIPDNRQEIALRLAQIEAYCKVLGISYKEKKIAKCFPYIKSDT